MSYLNANDVYKYISYFMIIIYIHVLNINGQCSRSFSSAEKATNKKIKFPFYIDIMYLLFPFKNINNMKHKIVDLFFKMYF